MSTPTLALNGRQGRRCVRGRIHASRRAGSGRTRCGASPQVRRHDRAGRVGGSRFLQTDPIPGAGANAYDYVDQDPINDFDLDGRWGWKSFLKKVGKIASLASFIPGPIGMVAAGIGAAAYAGAGDWRGAAECGLGMLGGGMLGHALTKMGRLEKFGTRMSHSKMLGTNSRLFGRGGKQFRKGILNRGSLRVGWGPLSKSQTAFRVGMGGPGTRHFDMLHGDW